MINPGRCADIAGKDIAGVCDHGGEDAAGQHARRKDEKA